jgi:hypothetical protein
MNIDQNNYIKYKPKYVQIGGKKLTDEKYKNRPSPPYHANDCKGRIMKGNDGNEYISKKDKNNVYHWVKMKHECKKLTDEKYKNRPSPPYHANDCKDKIMKGNDKKDYISKEDKNGVYHWVKLKDFGKTKTPEEYYSQFKPYEPKYDKVDLLKKLNLVEKELLKSKIYLIHIGWNNVYNFSNYAWDDALEFLQKKLKLPNNNSIFDNVSFMFYTDKHLFVATINGELPMQNNILNKDKKVINDAFKKYFGKSYKESKNAKQVITVKLNKL